MDWESDARGDKQVGAIAKALKGAETLYLATDPDREGEAISWHVRAMLEDKKALKGVEVHRITFNEITRNAVRYAIGASARPRPAADRGLPGAPRAGLPGGLHAVAGAVAQAARQPQRRARAVGRAAPDLRARSRDRGVPARANTGPSRRCSLTPAGAPFTARLTHLNGKRLDQFDLNNETLALRGQGGGRGRARFTVGSVERKRVKRNPPPPFTTSTLQQEASRKLGFGAQQTMRLAQQLYEGVDIDGETTGLITYMRTDGVQMAREAIAAIREHVEAAYGAELPAGRAARIQQQGQERAGGARGDPADRCRPHAGQRRRATSTRPAAAVRADLEARRRVADAVGRTRPGQRRRHRRQGPEAARHRLDRRVRRLPEAVSRGSRTTRPEEDEGRMLPPMAERDPLKRGTVDAQPALHPAAAALSPRPAW